MSFRIQTNRGSSAPPAPTFARAPVLVVEDDGDLREIIADVLADQKIPVIVAANGQQALDCLAGIPVRPSLILLDMMMPVMDGWRFREAMLGDPGLAAIPVVVMSAHADARRVAAEIGAVGSLAKPVSVAELLRQATRVTADASEVLAPRIDDASPRRIGDSDQGR